jgi:hypothetical protein
MILSETFLYTSLVIILLLITLIFFLKTPKEKRTLNHAFKENKKRLKNKLKSYPEEAEAVIIKAQKKKAFFYILPIIILMLPVIILHIYTKYMIDMPVECYQIFNTNLTVISYKTTFITMAVLTQISAFYLAFKGYKIYKNKYNPPLDSVWFQDLISKKSKDYKITAVIQISMPLLVLLLNLYTYNALNKLCDDDCKKKFDKRIIQECKEIHVLKIHQ